MEYFNVIAIIYGGDFNAPVENWGIEPHWGGELSATKLPPRLLYISQYKDRKRTTQHSDNNFLILQFGPHTIL